MDDSKIIDLYFERNEQAIKETEEKYGRLCYSIANHILNNHEDSEECVNDTYNGIWNAIPPARPTDFKAFLCKIVRNLSLKRLEFLNREKRSSEMTVSLEELAEVLPDDRYASDVADGEVGRLISEFLRGEKEETRNVFIRRYYFFDTVAEIATRYSFTKSKVKNMLFYTRNKLKAFLVKEGVEI